MPCISESAAPLLCSHIRYIPMYVCMLYTYMYVNTDKTWFCSADCENSYRTHHVSVHITPNVEKDHIREYSRAVAWQCLLHKVRLDAERENDGLTLNILWKIDLIQFWKENHFKYIILSHRLTSGMFTVIYNLSQNIIFFYWFACYICGQTTQFTHIFK